MAKALLKRVERIEPIALASAGKLDQVVYGVVDRVDNVDGELIPHFIRKWKGTIGSMQPTDEEPTIFIIEKLEPFILKHKKHKGAFGGRAGTKSIMAMDAMAGDVTACGSKVFVMRERMKSLKESIYAGIEGRVKDLDLGGFLPVPSQWEIRHKTGGKFSFGGMQNIIDMKGSFNYKYFLMEEAARTSQQTIDTLGPTLRNVEGAELWWIWNPESSNDPMSQEFIVPFQDSFDRDGYYEDDYHLIIKVGYEDNPWFVHDKSLNDELLKDKEKVSDGRMSRSRFNWIWNGMFNDDVEDSVILADWFDACIDAHKKLGFSPKGARVAAHDPADVGNDEKGYAARHGVVFDTIKEIDAHTANDAFDVACRMAKEYNADSFGWDCDGMGALLRNQASENFRNTKMHTFMYKGSEGPHSPKATFDGGGQFSIVDGKKNGDVFKNKKAQNIINFAKRVYRTYEAVKLDKYHDPETLVSFDSKSIPSNMIAKLRSECCRVPLKPGSSIVFYTKQEMRKGITQQDGRRLKIPSPNLFDAVVLSFDKAGIIDYTKDEEINFDSIF